MQSIGPDMKTVSEAMRALKDTGVPIGAPGGKPMKREAGAQVIGTATASDGTQYSVDARGVHRRKHAKPLSKKARRRLRAQGNAFASALATAEKHGWAVPGANDPFGAETWLRYWQNCADYARNPAGGRPVPPCRPGGGARLGAAA